MNEGKQDCSGGGSSVTTTTKIRGIRQISLKGVCSLLQNERA
jgi:hypothetical protein